MNAPSVLTQSAEGMVAQPSGFAMISHPATYEQARQVAEMLAKSDLVPLCFRDKPGDIMIAGAMGARLGLDLLSSLAGIAPINGRATIWGDLMLAVCQRRPDFEAFEESFTGTPYEATFTAVCMVKRKGQLPKTETFSVGDAKNAALWDERPSVTKQGRNGGTYEAPNSSPWYRYPKRMLQMRARAFALRGAFADALAGFHAREEMDSEDILDAEVVPKEALAPEPKAGKRRVVKEPSAIVTAEGEAKVDVPAEKPASDKPVVTESAAVDGPGEAISPSPETAAVTVVTTPEPPPRRIQKLSHLLDLAAKVVDSLGEESARVALKTICGKFGVLWVKQIQEARWDEAAKAMDDAMGVA